MKDDSVDLGVVFKFVFFALLIIVGLLFVFGSVYTINAGERGIVSTFGNPSMTPMSEGIHFKIPIAQSVVKMDIKTQKYETKASAASKDLQTVSTDIAVNYHINGETTPLLYKEIGVAYGDKIIQPAVQEVVKASTAHYTAEELITNRQAVKDEIDTLLTERLGQRGIIMETTSITNFDFSAEFNAAIEQKVTAEQNALTQKNKLAQVEYEAQQLVATANGQRDSQIAVAEGQAKTIELTAQAEADKVRLIQEQLKQSPQYIEYTKANRWNGALPNIMMGSGVVPLMQIPILNNS